MGRARQGAALVGLLLPALGAAWLAAASATGQRYPGASLAWAAPAARGFALAAGGAALVALLAARLRDPAPVATAARVLRPLWLSWVIVALLLLSPDANHSFANWPRLRVAAVLAVLVPVAVACELAALRLLERRYALLSRLARRLGGSTLVFAGSLLLFVASAGGHLYTPDEWTIYAAAAGLVNHGVPAAYADEPYPLHLLGGVRPVRPHGGAEERPAGTVDRVYSKYGVLPSILAAPLYAVARVTGPGPDLPRAAFPYENRALPLVPLLLNPLVTAATAALLFRVARDLGYARRAALAAAAAFALGSLAWPYAKTLMNMTLAAGLLLASFWCVLRAGCSGGRPAARWLLGGGAAAGLATATRYEVLLFVAPLAALCGWPFRAPARPPGARGLRSLALFGAGLGAVTGPLVLGLNALRTGDLLDPGYGGEGTLAALSQTPWYGLFGITLSPGCGLVPHTPLMALGLVALLWFWEDAPGPALAAGAAALLSIAYYGSLTTTWCAFATWGPRYLLVVAPFMALPLAAVWQRLNRAGANPFVWCFGGGLLAWSMGTNLLAVLVDFNRGWQDHWAHGVTYLETTWLPFFSGITSHFRLLREWVLDGRGGLDLYLVYALGALGWPALIALLAAALACGAAAWLADDPAPAGAAQGVHLVTDHRPLERERHK